MTMNARGLLILLAALALAGCPKPAPDRRGKKNNVPAPTPAARQAAPASDQPVVAANLGTSEYWVQRLGHPDPDQRERAAQALSRRGEHGVADAIRSLNDPNPQVRTSAVRVCSLMGPIAPEIVPALTAKLKDGHAAVRAAAARALGEMGLSADSAVSDLIYALNDDDPAVAEAAEQAIAKIQGG